MRRSHYLENIKKDLHLPLIKVLVGLRRVGKTTLLQQIQEEFDWKKPLTINFEVLSNEPLMDYQTLYQHLQKAITTGTNVIFLDEIQRVYQREKTINSIHTEYPQVQIFITGSNSALLSSELSTYLRGRHIEYYIAPFSYSEYCEYYEYEQTGDHFEGYLQQGGLSFLYQFEDKTEQLLQLIDTVFVRDIMERHQVRDVSLLKELLLFLFQNSGNITNASKLSQHLAQKKIITNYNTIYQYFSYLEEALMVDEIELYDLQGKTRFERLKKRYPVDHSCISLTRSGFDLGIAKQLETYIYNSAKVYGWKSYVGRWKDQEIDFVFEKGSKKMFVQVAYLLSTPDIIQREYQILLNIPENYPKYVISTDPYLHEDRSGVQHLQAWNREKVLQASK